MKNASLVQIPRIVIDCETYVQHFHQLLRFRQSSRTNRWMITVMPSLSEFLTMFYPPLSDMYDTFAAQ
jgi:hypothetical protein